MERKTNDKSGTMTLKISKKKKEELNERAKKATKKGKNHTQILKMF